MNTAFFASAIVLCVGVLWGVYWLPVRAIAEPGLDSAWGTGAITLAAMLFLLPFVAGKTYVFKETGIVGVVSGVPPLRSIPSGFSTETWRLSSSCGFAARSVAC